MRPPNDFPPAKIGNPGAWRAASATALRTASSATAGGSGRLFFACIWGKSNRCALMPRASSASAARCMKGWCIPAPAPCANTYTYFASVFANEFVEAFQHAHERGLQLEHFDDRIVPQLLHALPGIRDREVAVAQLGVHLIPLDRHRDGSAGRWPHAVGRDHQLAGAVLEGVDVDFPFALADRALRR